MRGPHVFLTQIKDARKISVTKDKVPSLPVYKTHHLVSPEIEQEKGAHLCMGTSLPHSEN